MHAFSAFIRAKKLLLLFEGLGFYALNARTCLINSGSALFVLG
jgi:hypothetical protein